MKGGEEEKEEEGADGQRVQRGEREQMRPYSLFSLTEGGKGKVGNSTMKVMELGNEKIWWIRTFVSFV